MDIDALESNYEANWTDDETITVTFFKNGKIYKTISDYGRMAPYPFIWARMRLEEAYKNIKLEPIAAPDYLTSFGPINKIQYFTSDRLFFIRKAEWFLLYEQLLNAKQTKHSFKPKFSFEAYNYWDPGQKVNEIASDGRYYKFMVKGKAITLDIGYDFLGQNKAALSFTDKRNSIKH